MTTNSHNAAGPTHKAVEAGVTLLIALFGVIVIVGSMKAGINWGAEGPARRLLPVLYRDLHRRLQRDQSLARAARRGRRRCSRNGDSFARC